VGELLLVEAVDDVEVDESVLDLRLRKGIEARR